MMNEIQEEVFLTTGFPDGSSVRDTVAGKCATCRIGLSRMYEIVDDITKGKATDAHLDLLEETAETVLFYWMNSWKELHPKKEK